MDNCKLRKRVANRSNGWLNFFSCFDYEYSMLFSSYMEGGISTDYVQNKFVPNSDGSSILRSNFKMIDWLKALWFANLSRL